MSASTLKRITNPKNIPAVTYTYDDPKGGAALKNTTYPVFYTMENDLPGPSNRMYQQPLIVLFFEDEAKAKTWEPTDFSQLEPFSPDSPGMLFLFLDANARVPFKTLNTKKGVSNWMQSLLKNLDENGASGYTTDNTWLDFRKFITESGNKVFSWGELDQPFSYDANGTLLNGIAFGQQNSVPYISTTQFIDLNLYSNGEYYILKIPSDLTPKKKISYPKFFENGTIGINRLTDSSQYPLYTSDKKGIDFYGSGYYFSFSCYGENPGQAFLDVTEDYPNNPSRSWNLVGINGKDCQDGIRKITYNLQDYKGKLTSRTVYLVIFTTPDSGSSTHFFYIADSRKEALSLLSNRRVFLRNYLFELPGGKKQTKVKLLTIFFNELGVPVTDHKFQDRLFQQLGEQLFPNSNGNPTSLMDSTGNDLAPNQLWLWIDNTKNTKFSFSEDITASVPQSANQPTYVNLLPVKGWVDNLNLMSFKSHLQVLFPNYCYLKMGTGFFWQMAAAAVPKNWIELNYFNSNNLSDSYSYPQYPDVNSMKPIEGIIHNGTHEQRISGSKKGMYSFYMCLLNDNKLGEDFKAGNISLVPTNPKAPASLPTGLPGISDYMKEEAGALEGPLGIVKIKTSLDPSNLTNRNRIEYWGTTSRAKKPEPIDQYPVLWKFNPNFNYSTGCIEGNQGWLLNEIGVNSTGPLNVMSGPDPIQFIGGYELNQLVTPSGDYLKTPPLRLPDDRKEIDPRIEALSLYARMALGVFPNPGFPMSLFASQKNKLDTVRADAISITNQINGTPPLITYKVQGDSWIMAGLFSPESLYLPADSTISLNGSVDYNEYEANYLLWVKNGKANKAAPYGYWSQARGMTFFDTKSNVGSSVWAYLSPFNKDEFPALPMMFYGDNPSYKLPVHNNNPTSSWELLENSVLARIRWVSQYLDMLEYLVKNQPQGPKFYSGGGSTKKPPTLLTKNSVIRTPQGMLFTIGAKGTISNWTITQAKNNPLSFSFNNNTDPTVAKMLHGLMYNNATMVISRKAGDTSDPIANAFTNDDLYVYAGDETFTFRWDLATKAKGVDPIMIVKTAMGHTLADILQHPDYCIQLVNRKVDWQSNITQVVKKARANKAMYEDLLRVLDDPDWTGTLIFDCPLSYGHMSADVQMLLGGIDQTLTTEFVIVGQNILDKKKSNTITQNSISALIAYDPDEDAIIKTYPKPASGDPLFKTLKFNLKISHSQVAHFDARVALSFPQVFNRLMSLKTSGLTDAKARNVVMVDGHYIKDKDGKHGHIVFDSTGERTFSTTSTTQVVKELDVKDLRFYPVSSTVIRKQVIDPIIHNVLVGEKSRVVANFSLDGMMQFNKVEGLDLFSFSDADHALPFYNYVLSIPTIIDNEKNTAKNETITWQKNLLRLSQDGGSGHAEAAADSLLDDLPFKVSGFRTSSDGSITSGKFGGMDIKTDEIVDPSQNKVLTNWIDTQSKGLEFAIELTAPIGHLGALQKSRHLLKNSVFLGWRANVDRDDVGAIFIPPSGMSPYGSFNPQGVIKGTFGNVQLTYDNVHVPHTFGLELTDMAMHLLKLPAMLPNAKFGPAYETKDGKKVPDDTQANARLSIFGGHFHDPAAAAPLLEDLALGNGKKVAKKKKKKKNAGWAHTKKAKKGGVVTHTGIKEKEAEWKEFKADPVKFVTRRLNPFNRMGFHFGHASGIFHNLKLHTDLSKLADANGTVIDAAMLVLKDVPELKDDFMKLLKENDGKIYHKKDFSDPGDPKSKNYVTYDPNAGLLIYIAFDLLCLHFAAIFEDSNFFGAQLKVPAITIDKPGRTPTAKLSKKIQTKLEGLIVEIIYRKISEHLGEWGVLLNLPKPMRVIKSEDVKFFLPSLGLQIWTDGSFKISLGWPYPNKALSKLGLEVPLDGIPVTLKTALFFAKLHGKDLPGTYADYFSSIYEFGIAATLGVVEEKKESMYYYKDYVRLGLTYEGFLASTYVAPSAVQNNDIDYYWFMGALSIQGGINATINLTIIKATLSVKGKIQISVAFETKHSLHIKAILSASVDVKIKFLFVTVHIHKDFHFTLFEKTFGNGPAASLKHPTPEALTSPKLDKMPTASAAALPVMDAFVVGAAPQVAVVPPVPLANSKAVLDQILNSLETAQLLTPGVAPTLDAYLAVLPSVVFNPKVQKNMVLSLVMESGTPDGNKNYSNLAVDGIGHLIAWVLNKVILEQETEANSSGYALPENVPANLQVAAPVKALVHNQYVTDLNNYNENRTALLNLYAIRLQLGEGSTNSVPHWLDTLKTTWLNDVTLNLNAPFATANANNHVPFPMPDGLTVNLAGKNIPFDKKKIEGHFNEYMQMVIHLTITELYNWQRKAAGPELINTYTTPQKADWTQIIYDVSNMLSRYFFHGAQMGGKGIYALTGQQVPITPSSIGDSLKLTAGKSTVFKTMTCPIPIDYTLPAELNLSKLSLTATGLVKGNQVSVSPLFDTHEKIWHLPKAHQLTIGKNNSFVRLPIDLCDYIANHNANTSPKPTWTPSEANKDLWLGSSDGTPYSGACTYGLTLPISLNEISGSTGHYGIEALTPEYLTLLTKVVALNLGKVASVNLVQKQTDGSYSPADKPLTITRSNLAVSDLNPTGGGQPQNSPLTATNASVDDFLTLLWEASVIHQGGYLLHTDTKFSNSTANTSKGAQAISTMAKMQLLIVFQKQFIVFDRQSIDTNLVNTLLFQEMVNQMPVTQVKLNGARTASTLAEETVPTTNVGTINWDVQIPASTYGKSFSANTYVQSLYHIAQYQLTPGTQPVDPKAWSLSHGHHHTQVNGKDMWEFHLRSDLAEITKAKPNLDPYSILGKPTTLHVRLLDIFGNATEDLIQKTYTPVYSDLLESPVHWPGMSITYEVLTGKSKPQLQFDLHYTPIDSKDYIDPTVPSGTPEYKKQHDDYKKGVAKLKKEYLHLQYQINDADSMDVFSTLWDKDFALSKPATSFLTTLQGLAASIAKDPSKAQKVTPISFDLNTSKLPDTVLFELAVAIQLNRKDEATLYDATMLKELPEVKSVRTTIHASTDSGLKANPNTNNKNGKPDVPTNHRAFAKKFETAMCNVGSNTQLKLAQGPAHQHSKDHAHSLWVFKWQGKGLKPIIFKPKKQRQSPYSYWAPQPMSHVLVPTKTGHVDLDAQVRGFLRDLHLLQTPAKDAVMAKDGTFKSLMQLKRDLGGAIADTLTSINDDTASISAETKDFFQEQMYTSLTHDYGTTTLVTLPMDMANGNTIDNGPAVNHNPYFLGQVGPKEGANEINQAFIFSTAQTKVPKAAPASGLDDTNFLVTAQRAANQANLEVDLAFDLHSFDYRFHESEERYGLLPSTWLTFLVPDDKAEPTTQIILPKAKIPLPYRQFPNSPRLLSQTAKNDQKPITHWKNINETLTWAYELQLDPPQAAQDDLYLYLQFNETATAPKGFGPDALTLDEIKNDPQKTEFLKGLETFNENIAGCLSGDISNINDPSSGVLAAAQSVQKNWPKSIWGTTNAAESTTMGEYDILLKINKSSTGGYALTLVKVGRKLSKGISIVDDNILGATSKPLTINGKPVDLKLPPKDKGKGKGKDKGKGKGTSLNFQVPGLSIVNHQLARTYAFVERNSQLVSGVPTNQKFVYQSPVVKFPSPLVPYLDHLGLISMNGSDPSHDLKELFNEFRPDASGLGSDVKLQLTVNRMEQVGISKGKNAPHAINPLRVWQDDFKSGEILPFELGKALQDSAKAYAINYSLTIFSAVDQSSNTGWTPLVHMPNIQWKKTP